MSLPESFTGDTLALPLVLLAGLIAGSNPCCLAVYPAAAGACCTTVQGPTSRRFTAITALFVLGAASAVAVLGLLAVLAGRIVALSTPWRVLIALIPVMIGVHRLGWINLSLPVARPLPWLKGRSSGAAFGVGLIFSLVAAPCSTPFMAAILSFASQTGNLLHGALLLFVYGIGASLPAVLVGTAGAAVFQRVGNTRFGRSIDAALSGLLILGGFYLLWKA